MWKGLKNRNSIFKCEHAKSLQLWSDSANLWTIAHQAPLSMGFSRQEYWSGLPCPPPGDLPDPEIEPASHTFCIGRQVLYHLYHLGRSGDLIQKIQTLCASISLFMMRQL